MDFFLQDPDEVRLPPEDVRLLDMVATPQPGSPRVKINLELTPFKKRPNLEVTITAPSGKQAAHVSILEAMQRKMEFTMHLRQVEPGSEYSLESVVYYQRLPEPSEEPVEVPLPDPWVVDRRKVTFILRE
jgi:hypothetical protein